MVDRRKKFSARGLSHSAAHHLLAVDKAISQHGYARVSDIARLLELTRGSVSVAMQSLKAGDYVTQDDSHFFHLTDVGRRSVASIRGRHEIVERFLTEVLALPKEDSHRESCRLENLIEAPTARRLYALLEFWQKNDFADALADEFGLGCPVCQGGQMEHCPCCGLECIDGTCPDETCRTPQVAKEYS